MNNEIELLAPAGDWDSFIAAVENGADAVYLGGKLFNARQSASNFDMPQLKKALDYAHVRGVKIYLTMNTLIADHEMQEALEFAGEACRAGIDAVIVQDIGLASCLHKIFPDLQLHASTQMTVYNIEGVRLLQNSGFRRIVLARELTLDEIRNITKNTDAEIEIFVHGALCVCYSGQCLMSSIIGGRSGNRGRCAQPCRLPYQLERLNANYQNKHINFAHNAFESRVPEIKKNKHEGHYLLSPKDICTLDILEDIISSGVKSLKIEGRMKNPEYVAIVVGTYRKYLDVIKDLKEKYVGQSDSKVSDRTFTADTKKLISEKDMENITQIFNRGGFSYGYLKGKTGRSMMSYEKPKNWGIYIGKVINFNKKSGDVKFTLENELCIGDGIEIWNGDDESPGTVVSSIKVKGQKVQCAVKGTIVEVGRLRGKISAGDKIYRTSSKKLNEEATKTYSGKYFRKVPLKCSIKIRENEPLILQVYDDKGNKTFVQGEIIAQRALKHPITKERIYDQMKKTGNTPFYFSDINIHIEDEVVLPVSEINAVRRKALENMEKIIIENYGSKCADYENKAVFYAFEDKLTQNDKDNTAENIKAVKPQLSLFFYNPVEGLDYKKIKADIVYLTFTFFMKKESTQLVDLLKQRGIKVYASIPSITRGNMDSIIKSHLQQVTDTGIDGVMIGNIGSLEYLKDFNIEIRGDYSLNIFNSFSIDSLHGMGLSGTTISPELSIADIRKLKKIGNFLTESIIYGRIPLMVSEYYVVGSVCGGFDENNKCKGVCAKAKYVLKDRKGITFPILCDNVDCRSMIFNSNVIYMADKLDMLKEAGINVLRMNIVDENPQDIVELTQMHYQLLQDGIEVLKEFGKLHQRIKEKGFTRGHYFRGVE